MNKRKRNADANASLSKAKKPKPFGKKHGSNKKIHTADTKASTLKAKRLLENPVNVDDAEFKEMGTFEEMENVKLMGMTKTNKPFFQDWKKDGYKVKVSNPEILHNFESLEDIKKTRLSGKEIVSDEDDDFGNSNKPKNKKKHKKIDKGPKASYDKTPEQVESITQGQASQHQSSLLNPAFMQKKIRKNEVDVSAWNELLVPDCVKKALSEIGFSTPTEIQSLCIGTAIKERCDVLGAAETGSGKTLAFGIPIIAGILRDREKTAAALQKKKETEIKREETKLQKQRMADALREENDSSESEEDESEDDGYVETDEEDVEEYLYNGEDGIAEIGYDEMENNELDSEDGSDDSEGGSDDGEARSDDGEARSDDDSLSEDLGSSDEEDFENEDVENPGLVRAINNVQFPFLKKSAPVEDSIEKPLLKALILTPTRELAVQIHSHLSQVCKYSNIKSGIVVGGLDARKQKRLLRRTCPEIVVATPGRLWELIKEGIDHLKELGAVRYLAIDEADRMIDRKNFEEVGQLIRHMNGGTLKNRSGTDRQTFIFSATLSLVHQLPNRLKVQKKSVAAPSSEEKLQKLAKMVGCKPSAKTFDVTRKEATAEALTECRINCELHEKDYYLYYFLMRHPGRTMVFCNSIEAVKRLKSVFSMLKCNPQDLHASMHQKQRLRHLQQFASRGNSLLITTDVAARGLDIRGVQHVIHYQVPFTAESYVHRSGRTARANRKGLSIVFVEPKDMMRFKSICATLNRSGGVTDIPQFPVEEAFYDQITERVDLAVSVEKLEHSIRKEDREKEDKIRNEKEAGLVASDEELDQEDLHLLSAAEQFKYRPGAKKNQLKRLRRELDTHLAKPIMGALFSYNYPRSKASVEAVMGTGPDSVPDTLIGMNPTENIIGGDREETYRQRYARELFGEVDGMDPSVTTKNADFELFKQQRKAIAKMTKKLLKPETMIKEDNKKIKEKLKQVKLLKAEKKREKRRKKKLRNK